MSVTAAAAVFPEAAFRPHFKTSRSSAKGKGRAVLRATGDVFIPESLSRHVEFVSGLTELWPGDGMGKLDGARAGLGGAGGMEVRVLRFSVLLSCRVFLFFVRLQFGCGVGHAEGF